MRSKKHLLRILHLLVILVSAGASMGQEMTYAEYYLDDDPGPGNGIPLAFEGPTDSLSFNLDLEAEGLSSGIHTLYIRARNEEGLWSFASSSTIVIEDRNNGTANSYEYFLKGPSSSTEPKVVQLDQEEAFNFPVNLSAQEFEPGFHALYVRSRAGADRWSHWSTHPVYIDKPAPTVNTLELLSSGGEGTYTTEALTSKIMDSLHIAGNYQAPNAPFGDTTLFLRAGDDAGNWSHPVPFDLSLCESFGPLAGFQTMVNGGEVFFTDTSLYAGSYSWKFGDGSIDTTANPVHQYTSPGNYTVELDVQNVCGSSSIEKTISIQGITAIQNSEASSTAILLSMLEGAGFTETTAAYLSSEDQTIFPADRIFYDQNRIGLKWEFLAETVGFYDLVVLYDDGSTDTLHNGFEITPMQFPDLEIKVTGAPKILFNRSYTFHVDVTNNSNEALFAVPVRLKVTTDEVTANLLNTVENPGFTDDFLAFYDFQEFTKYYDQAVGDSCLAKWLILPVVNANSTATTYVNIRSIGAGAEFEVQAVVGNPRISALDILLAQTEKKSGCSTVMSALGAECLDCLIDFAAVVPVVGCAATALSLGCRVGDAANRMGREGFGEFFNMDQYSWMSVSDEIADILGGAACLLGLNGAASAADEAVEAATLAERILAQGINGYDIAGSTVGFGGATLGCMSSCGGQNGTTRGVRALASRDPNIKIGPSTPGEGNFVFPGERADYRIYYENADSATAPASEVFITDEIDTTKFDFSSLKFNGFGFANREIDFLYPEDSFATEIDLRPDLNTILRIEGRKDYTNNVVKWSFISLDPATRKLTDDADAGFLPPNKTAPEGEGYVSYFIRMHDDLPHGTEITNLASIVFDRNEAIITPPWITEIDLESPVSLMQSMPEVSNDTLIMLSWEGIDDGSGVFDYTLYYSENGGPFQLGLKHTQLDSALFKGEFGSEYGFYVIARDRMMNQEIKSELAEINVRFEEASSGFTSFEETKIEIYPKSAPNPNIADLKPACLITGSH